MNAGMIGWGEISPFPLQMFGGSQSTSTPQDVTPPELAALRTPFANAIQGLIGTNTGGGVSGIPAWGQPFTAPLAAGETAGLSSLSTAANNPLRTGQINSTLSGNYLPGQPGANPFLEAAIAAAQRPTFQGLEETLSRTLPGRFTQAGQFTQPQGSSAFDRAAAIAGRGAEQTAADIATKMSSDAYAGERTNQMTAVGLSQEEIKTSIANLQAQALPRLIAQYGIDQGLAEFQNRIDAVLKALTISTGAPLVSVGNASQSTTQPNIFGALMGGLSGFTGP